MTTFCSKVWWAWASEDKKPLFSVGTAPRAISTLSTLMDSISLFANIPTEVLKQLWEDRDKPTPASHLCVPNPKGTVEGSCNDFQSRRRELIPETLTSKVNTEDLEAIQLRLIQEFLDAGEHIPEVVYYLENQRGWLLNDQQRHQHLIAASQGRTSFLVCQSYPPPSTEEAIQIIGAYSSLTEAEQVQSLENLGRDYSSVSICYPHDGQLWKLTYDGDLREPLVKPDTPEHEDEEYDGPYEAKNPTHPLCLACSYYTDNPLLLCTPNPNGPMDNACIDFQSTQPAKTDGLADNDPPF